MESNFNLAAPFFASAKKSPDSLAICADGRERTYREARAVVQSLANWLQKTGDRPPRYVGILASRSWEACAGILGTACAGGTYVALNLSDPAAALASLLRGIELDALIADRAGVRLLTPEVMQHAPRKILLPAGYEPAQNNGHAIHTFETLKAPGDCVPRLVGAGEPAYVEFTSGSTGSPKGVVISNGSVAHFLTVMQRRYEIQPTDRIAETTDTSFDLSVFNMFMSWMVGASLHVVPKRQAIAPAKFIRDHEITVWFSVPSIGAVMNRMNLLAPGVFPSLRVSLFAGEPLQTSVVRAWKTAAPNSVVDNLYGPTEATVICLYERVGEKPNVTKERDIISIGRPLEGTEVAIWDRARACVSDGTPGEIVLSGAQLSLGYLNDPDKTAASFVTKDAKRWYRTGDLGYRDESGLLHHLGRIDNQVKVLGNRVELEEIEVHLRRVYNTDSVAAVAWPIEFGAATGIVGFVSGAKTVSCDTIAELRKGLPSYMVPHVVHVLDALPSNASGKVDRKVLAQKLQRGEF